MGLTLTRAGHMMYVDNLSYERRNVFPGGGEAASFKEQIKPKWGFCA